MSAGGLHAVLDQYGLRLGDAQRQRLEEAYEAAERHREALRSLGLSYTTGPAPWWPPAPELAPQRAPAAAPPPAPTGAPDDDPGGGGTPADLTASALLAAYAAGDLSPPEVVDACLERIAAVDPPVRAVATLTRERALAAAEESARRWRRGTPLPLDGVPFGVKDVIATAGVPTRAGSTVYEEHVPSRTAPVVTRLEEAGGLHLAKTRTYEFAIRCDRGDVSMNPWDPGRTAGGSSSGSAAAVAARMLPLTVGTDTGGSIRSPAGWCGATAVKPTFGLVPTDGVYPLAWTLDSVGPLARSARDCVLALAVMAGRPLGEGRPPLDGDLADLRLGVARSWFLDVCDPQVEAGMDHVLDVLAGAGATVEEVTLPTAPLVDPVFWGITLGEIAAVHEQHLDHLDRMDPRNADLVVLSQTMTAGDYLRAARGRRIVRDDLAAVLGKVDLVVTPGPVCVAPRLGELLAVVGDRSYPWMQMNSRNMKMFSLTGNPVLALPSGFTGEWLPVGVQVVGRPGADWECLRAGAAFQVRTTHHRAAPQVARR